ncbi:MAG TPA: sigma-70 family RNA polymerase sigma factor [Bryobacteraceae bacterium]|jgi:RNA polymerase sigma-70 factor (ECF subfamily)|nr:sigma-70 family RNA polymerase sigma factor [Bryobacteraceae bacterium]
MLTQSIAAIPKVITDDPERFEELVREHQAMVFSMACRYLRNRALAEEIAQDVFLQLYRKLPSLESQDHVVHWLRWVTAHRLIDHSRHEKRRPQSPLEEAPEPAVPANSGDPLLSDMLRDLVAALPENARVVMILRYQEDLDPMDIAQALDMPIATVKSHLQRSLALLRDKLSRQKGVGL